MHWAIPYLRVPHNIYVEPAKYLLSIQFNTLATSVGCNLIPVVVEAHLSTLAERYHDQLRPIANNVSIGQPSAPVNLVTDYTNLAMSPKIGPEGCTPVILAFGTQPRLPVGQYSEIPQTLSDSMDLTTTVRREYEGNFTSLSVRKVSKISSPVASAI